MNKPKFFSKKLKNGMTVLFEERKGSGVVSVAFAARHGGIHESKDEKGISHFIEHLLYKGTQKRNALQISKEIEKNGGILNGFTEEELTAYWCKMPSKHIDLALDVLSDMVKNPKFDPVEIEKERRVIFEEMKMRKDMPQIFVFDEIQNYLYTGNLSFNLIGTEETLGKMDRKAIVRKFEEIYSPNNMVLCVVGDSDFKKLCDFAEKNFPKTESVLKEPEVGLHNKHAVIEREGLDQVNLIFAYHVPAASDNKNYAAQVLTCIMAGGMSSRLFSEIREKRNLAYAVKGNSSLGKRFGYNTIFVGTSAENAEKVKKLIIEEFKKVFLGLEMKEFQEAQEQLIGNSRISREESQGQMTDLLFSEISTNAKDSYEYEKNIRAVKIEDVRKLAGIKDYSFVALVPKPKNHKK